MCLSKYNISSGKSVLKYISVILAEGVKSSNAGVTPLNNAAPVACCPFHQSLSAISENLTIEIDNYTY